MKGLRARLLAGVWLLSLTSFVFATTILRTHVRLGVLDALLQIGLLAFTVALLGLAVAYYHVYYGLGPQDGIIRKGPREPTVALTFDDGPSPLYTPRILDILRDKNVKATFFLVGKQVAKYPQIARRILDEGHEIGNHTHSHRDLAPASRRVVRHEVEKAEHAIGDATGVRTRLLRPPRGMYTNSVRKLLIEDGYTIALWNVSSRDWQGLSAQRILARVKAFIRPGGILLFHDSGALFRREGASRSNTVDALQSVIDYLQLERGYRLAPVSELLAEQELEAEEAWGKL